MKSCTPTLRATVLPAAQIPRPAASFAINPTLKIALLVLAWFLCGQTSALRAQQPVLAASVRVNLNPTQFNLESLPGFAQGGNAIFSQPISILVYQWTDGTIAASPSSRSEKYKTSTNQTITTSVTAGDANSSTFTVMGPPGSGASTTFGSSTTTTVSTTTTTVTGWDIVNSLSLEIQGNLVSAVIEYTSGTVIYKDKIDLGLITQEGGFSAFKDGPLTGKNILADPENANVPTNIDQNNAPADTDTQLKWPPDTPIRRGFVSRSPNYQPVQARVVVGYWVVVGRVNGIIVSCSVSPVYQEKFIGFRALGDVPPAPLGLSALY